MDILVIDDDSVSNEILQAICQKEQYNIYSAEDGNVGWALFQEHLPQIVLLDLNLPGENGLSICRKIKSLDPGKNSIVIMLTAHESLDDMKLMFLAGADDYIPKPFNHQLVRTRLKVAEKLLERDHERFHLNPGSSLPLSDSASTKKKTKISSANEFEGEKSAILSSILDNIRDGVIAFNQFQELILYNNAAELILGNEFLNTTPDQWTQNPNIIDESLGTPFTEKNFPLFRALHGETIIGQVVLLKKSNNKELILSVNTNPLLSMNGSIIGAISLIRDVTELKRSEKEHQRLELLHRQTQKLESIGELAAGIAHEINTPIQYIGDNTHFLEDSFTELNELIESLIELKGCVDNKRIHKSLLRSIENKISAIDLNYLQEEIPKAISQSLTGIYQVSQIVRSMKEFSHPGAVDKKFIDINQAIENVITISKNEWKYVANVETGFDHNIPMIECYPGEFNQVILNLIINAAHAIGEKKYNEKNGIIRIETRHNQTEAEIKIIDNGKGIPSNIVTRIFDPFFTTKDVGKGTGQGLALAHSIIVEKHKGIIAVEETPGGGATFIVRLPIAKNEKPG